MYVTEVDAGITSVYKLAKTSKRLVLTRAGDMVILYDTRHLLHDDGGAVKLHSVNGCKVGRVSGTVQLFSKPHPSVVHSEVMRANRARYYTGADRLDVDYIIGSLQELQAQIHAI